MHSKRKGNIGQLYIAASLAAHEFSVFTEQGDISKIDIIAEKNGKMIRIQCKAIQKTLGCLILKVTKSGPNYFYHYQKTDVDFFGVCDLMTKKCYLIPSSILDTNKDCIYLRLDIPKNKQNKKIHYASDFSLEKILRDYTRDTQ